MDKMILTDSLDGNQAITLTSIHVIEEWIRDNPTAPEECHTEMRRRLRELKNELNSTKNNNDDSSN